MIDYSQVFGTVDESVFEAGVPMAESGDGILRTEEQCRQWAESLGCELKAATDTQLFVDLDTDAAWQLFQYQIKVLKKHFYFKEWKVTPSKQGLPHQHVIVEMAQPYPLIERIALQACLGSDLLREMLSIRRALNKEDNVVIFFEKKPGDA